MGASWHPGIVAVNPLFRVRPGLTIDLAGGWRGFSCWGGVPTISGANLFAGLLIIFTKPFRIGEYIEIVGVKS